MARTIARVSNYAFGGTELGMCSYVTARKRLTGQARNQNYIFNVIHYPRAAVISAEVLRLLPEWTKWLVLLRHNTTSPSQTRRPLTDSTHSYVSRILPSKWCIKLASFQIGSYIQKRIDDTDTYGAKRDDLLQHLIDHAPESQRTSEELIKRMWSLNLGSVHTSAIVSWEI
jgi:hypothetical protein